MNEALVLDAPASQMLITNKDIPRGWQQVDASLTGENRTMAQSKSQSPINLTERYNKNIKLERSDLNIVPKSPGRIQNSIKECAGFDLETPGVVMKLRVKARRM